MFHVKNAQFWLLFYIFSICSNNIFSNFTVLYSTHLMLVIQHALWHLHYILPFSGSILSPQQILIHLHRQLIELFNLRKVIFHLYSRWLSCNWPIWMVETNIWQWFRLQRKWTIVNDFNFSKKQQTRFASSFH